MIFVTVGTHEQPFNRLIQCIDELKKIGIIKEDVIMQIGYSTYIPHQCKWKKMFLHDEMIENVQKARIVITHGGPASFLMAVQMEKIPIVVPRQYKYGEHVNDHQLRFARVIAERQNQIILVEEIDKLKDVLLNYDVIESKMHKKMISNNEKFNMEFERVIDKLFL